VDNPPHGYSTLTDDSEAAERMGESEAGKGTGGFEGAGGDGRRNGLEYISDLNLSPPVP
jgi:hypothetical protein